MKDATSPGAGAAGEVFTAFLKLGLSAFGGPVAHLGYFRREFVERRRWLDESQYAQLLAICQFLPGPASSQVGFGIGLLRAGWRGALAAFVAFTAPSAVLLIAFATLLPPLPGPITGAALHGLKLVAFAVVAQALLGMQRQLCPDRPRLLIATVAAAVLILWGSAGVQLGVVLAAAVAGIIGCRDGAVKPVGDLPVPYRSRWSPLLLSVFALLLLALPGLAAGGEGYLAVFDAFYRAGALVFGGGHVVLPLLEEYVVTPGWVNQDYFLAGYGAAQAVPGPLFSFAAYLGYGLPAELGGWTGALVAVLAIFLPGFLLVAGLLPLWRRLAGGRITAAAVAGVNAGVVGLLGAALYDPIFVTAIRGGADMAIALVAFVLLAGLRLSALYAVVWCVLASVAMRLLV